MVSVIHSQLMLRNIKWDSGNKQFKSFNFQPFLITRLNLIPRMWITLLFRVSTLYILPIHYLLSNCLSYHINYYSITVTNFYLTITLNHKTNDVNNLDLLRKSPRTWCRRFKTLCNFRPLQGLEIYSLRIKRGLLWS